MAKKRVSPRARSQADTRMWHSTMRPLTDEYDYTDPYRNERMTTSTSADATRTKRTRTKPEVSRDKQFLRDELASEMAAKRKGRKKNG